MSELERTIFLEIIDQYIGVFADVSEIDCLASFGEEEQTVKFLEENGRRLMNCAENSLTIVC